MNDKKNKAARQLFVGAAVHNLFAMPAVENYKSTREKDLQIVVPITAVHINTTVVNEIKLLNGPGSQPILVVNGGSKKLEIPANSEFVNDVRQFKFESAEESPKVYLSSHKTACDIAEAQNNGEIIRIDAIITELETAKKMLKDINSANRIASAAYPEDEE